MVLIVTQRSYLLFQIGYDDVVWNKACTLSQLGCSVRFRGQKLIIRVIPFLILLLTLLLQLTLWHKYIVLNLQAFGLRHPRQFVVVKQLPYINLVSFRCDEVWATISLISPEQACWRTFQRFVTRVCLFSTDGSSIIGEQY